MTYTYTHLCSGDYRNEGWTFGGSGVSACWQAWNNDDDSKYASCPGYRGRACVSFPIDISSGSIPDGAVITSVSIWIRVRRMFAEGKSVTVNILSRDDTSKYTSRTIYPGSTVNNYEVGTYKTDPLGRTWTKDRLNRLMAQVFSYSVPPNDGVRVYKLWAVVNYKVRPTLVINSPTGTVTTATPTISWTYTHPEGDLQKYAEYKIFTADQQASTTFNPDNSTAVYKGIVSGDITSLTLPQPLPPNDYYIYVRSQSVYNCWSIWVNHTFTVAGAAPGAPGGAAFGGVGTGGTGGFESVVVDHEASNAYLTLRDGSNLLSVQQADFETTTDWLGYTTTNCAIAQDTTTFFNVGSGSMKLTASSAATMAATSSYQEIAPNAPITVRAQSLAAATGRTVNLSVLFYDSSYTLLGGTVTASGTDSTSTWTEVVGTGTTPDTGGDTLYCRVQLQVVSPANAEVHNFDNVGLMYGTGSAWSHGGHMSRNILTASQSAASGGTATEWTANGGTTYNGRVTAAGIGALGTQMFKATYAGQTPTVSFIAAGTAYSSTATGTGYTLNKPTGVADGDVLVAYIASDSGVATPPTGWTVVDSIDSTGSAAATLTILMRDGLAADPSTWVGNMTSSGVRRRTQVVCYRGAASTATQLSVENVSSSLSGALSIKTPVLNNTSPNAWRLTAFAIRDDASGGAMVANTGVSTSIPPISYVGKGANWWYGGAQGSFQINKPSGTTTGDLMLAFGAFAGTSVPTAPAGWTQVARNVATLDNGDDHSGTGTFVVWKRSAGSSEPASWTSTYTGTGTPLMTQTVAYRNCDADSAQFIASGTSQTTGNDYLNTATVTNTNSRAWRVSAWMATTPQGDTMSSTEVSERADNRTDVGAHPDVNIAVYDSNGPVSTGTHRRQAYTNNDNPWVMISWIGLLKPLSTAPGTGANETERSDGTTGAADGAGYLTLSVYDTGSPTTTGNQSVYGIFTPGSGTTTQAASAWEGFLIPSASITAGEVGTTLASYIDISSVPQEVLDRAGGKITLLGSFLGSTAGAPYLRLHFYNANELLSTSVASGNAFNSSSWVASSATFDIPAGTTRIKCGVAASDRTAGDYLCYDKMSIAFGSDTVWRYGTGRTNHPIYNVPVIQYADDFGDGYGDWAVLPGSAKALLDYDQLTGLCTYVDPTLRPGSARKYRANSVSYGLAGETFSSGYGAQSDEISLQATDWWLKDPTDPSTAMRIRVCSTSGGLSNLTADGILSVNVTNTASAFQPLGADRPVVLTEGYKGDSFSILVQTVGTAQYRDLRNLLNSGKTLFLQSNIDDAWWVRPIGDITSETQATHDMWTNPLRYNSITFVEVDPE